jgi:hypothetical protein
MANTPFVSERKRGNPGFIAARLEPWHEISRLLRISSGVIKTWVAALALAMTGIDMDFSRWRLEKSGHS